MFMRHPIDVDSRVSADLSRFMEAIVNDPDREQPPTLGVIRAGLQQTGIETPFVARLHPQDRESVMAEINDLIEEYGGDALAINFVEAKASEGLSRTIEAAANDASLPDEPTLGEVREAMLHGLVARLVGEGVIEPDEDQTLLPEIDDLIARYGEDAPAENFIRFE
jgi:hypothetical protein